MGEGLTQAPEALVEGSRNVSVGVATTRAMELASLFAKNQRSLTVTQEALHNAVLAMPVIESKLELIGESVARMNVVVNSMAVRHAIPDLTAFSRTLTDSGMANIHPTLQASMVNFGKNLMLESVAAKMFSFADLVPKFNIADMLPKIDFTGILPKIDLVMANVTKVTSEWLNQITIFRHLPVRAALDARDAMLGGDTESVNEFLLDFLDLDPTPERQQALWHVLCRSQRWLEIEPDGLIAYLRVSVYREAQRIRRDGELRDRDWGRLGQEPVVLDTIKADQVLWPDPALVVIRREDVRQWLGIVQGMIAAGLPPAQQQILRLFLAGFSPSDAIRDAGGSWVDWQALQRKWRRRLLN